MKQIQGDYKANDGKDYFNIVITKSNDVISFKNFSCRAGIESHCKAENIAIQTILHMNNTPIDIARVPKKYAHLFTQSWYVKQLNKLFRNGYNYESGGGVLKSISDYDTFIRLENQMNSLHPHF